MKKKLIKLLSAAICISFLLSVVSCGKPTELKVNESSSSLKKIGVSLAVTSHPFDQAEKESLENSAKENNFAISVRDAENKLSKQQADIEDLVSERIDYLVVVPIKEHGFKGIFYTAHEANLPIILINRGINGVPGEDFTALITSDGVWEGETAANWLLKNKQGDFDVIQLVGTPGATMTKTRTEGFNNIAKNNKRMKITESLVCDYSNKEAYKKMKELLKIYKKTNVKIYAVYAHNDSMALGAIKALEEAGMNPGKDVLVVGVDGQKEAKEAIESGKMSATITSSPYYGPIVMKNIKDLEAGKKIEPVQKIKGKLFDKTNIDKFTTAF